MKFISKSSLYIKMMYICDVTLVLRACDQSDLPKKAPDVDWKQIYYWQLPVTTPP